MRNKLTSYAVGALETDHRMRTAGSSTRISKHTVSAYAGAVAEHAVGKAGGSTCLPVYTASTRTGSGTKYASINARGVEFMAADSGAVRAIRLTVHPSRIAAGGGGIA